MDLDKLSRPHYVIVDLIESKTPTKAKSVFGKDFSHLNLI
ncbi:hypothetical protein D082_34410 [Synechocystis sp. PCC 6714]|nr:hypothetical protein D082_34410 [Synechocystis sp. PCC 6714]